MTTCVVQKIDSNVTGLSYAEEACLKVLPAIANGDLTDPIWRGLEPNSYSDFGGQLNTVSREPISAARQRKKGTVTSKEDSGGFNIDFTQSNLTRLLQGFFFANAHQKPATLPLNNTAQVVITTVANSDNSFNAASGLLRFLAGHVIKSQGTVSNNGVALATTVTTSKLIVSGLTLVNETATSAALLHAVGYQFLSGALTLTVSAAAAILAITGLVAATGTLTFTAVGTLADTITIGTQVYTLKTALTVPAVANEVLIGASATATATNLVAAINAVTGAGTLYGTGTVANANVSATNAAGVITVTALRPGQTSNAIATTKTSTAATWGAATLASGAGGAGWVELGLTPGEWIFLGDDNIANAFTQTASTNRPGYARVQAVTDLSLTLDDTTWTPQTDAGTGKTVRVYFGTMIRNEPLPANIVTRSYQLERTLGSDAVGVQSQYLVGAIANELKLNLPDADKINCDLTFIALDDTTNTGTVGLKSGSRIAAPGESAFNTSQDVYRIKLAIHDETTMDKAALFAFVQDASISVTNNAAPVRALGHIGAVDVSVGNFDTSGSITALFSTVDAIAAIQNNSDVGFSVIAARANGGFCFDIPLLGLGGGRLAVELNKPITLPLDINGAQNLRGYTLAHTSWSYLPTVAMPT